MTHTYANLIIHSVFGTQNHQKIITSEIKKRLCAYIQSIAKNKGFTVIEINGMSDHIHVLLNLSPGISVAEAMRLIKSNSSKWVHETFPKLHGFAWQEGYGAFSVSVSNVGKTKEYIRNQEEHHRYKTFAEEFELFLHKHGIVIEGG